MKESPPFDGVVFRGVKGDISGEYVVGETVVWKQFTSCAKKCSVLEQDSYLGKKGTRVLFEINAICRRARTIATIAMYPGEEEVLFPPNTPFLVEAKQDEGNDLVRVILTELPSSDPLLEF